MKQIKFIFANHNKQNQIIDNLIKTKEVNRRTYSQTLVIPYIPLTKKQKFKEIFDMDKSSQNRFNEYSNIFEQIISQTSDINNSLENLIIHNIFTEIKLDLIHITLNQNLNIHFIH